MAIINSTSLISRNSTSSDSANSSMQICSQQSRIQQSATKHLPANAYNTINKDSPDTYTWSILHQINFKKANALERAVPLSEYVCLSDLNIYFKRKATVDELLNVHLSREPNEKIREDDPAISVRDLINWKIMKTYPLTNFPLNRAVTWTELKNYLNEDPTPLQHLNCICGCKPAELNNQHNGPAISVDHLINLLKGRDRTTVPTLQEIAEYYGSHHVTIDILRKYLNREPTENEAFNWIEDRDLNHPITQEDAGKHKWKVHANRFLNHYDWNRSISFEDFKQVFPHATWREHFISDKEKTFPYEITNQDVDEYLLNNKIPKLKALINSALGRDNLKHPLDAQDYDNPFWKLIINQSLKRAPHDFIVKFELDSILGRVATMGEYFNCCLFRPLSHPVTKSDIEFWLSRPATLVDLAFWLGRLPTLAEEINFREGKDLSLGQNLSPHEHYRLLFGEDEGIGFEISCLYRYLNKNPTNREFVNWGLNRNLNTPLVNDHLSSSFMHSSSNQ